MSQVVVLLLVGTVVAAVLLGLFVSWERSGHEHRVVLLILALVVVEVTLYQDQDQMPRSLFHLGSGSFQFRLPEVLISLALVARLVARGRPRRIGGPALAWCGFASWMAVAAVEGLLRHNSTVQLPYELKAVVYIVGGYALAAGVPVRRLLDGRGLDRLVRWAALAAAVLIAMTLAHTTVDAALPGLPLVGFGALGGDAAGVFVALGVIGLLRQLQAEQRQAAGLLAVVPLLASAFFASQRAVLLELGVAVGTLVLVVVVGTATRRRLQVTGAESLLAGLAVLGVVLGAAVVPAIVGGAPVRVPLAEQLDQQLSSAVNTTAKAESAQDRLTKWSVAWHDVEQEPLLGQGLGFEYSYYASGPNQYVVTDITENLGLDLWLWTGVIGVLLFAVALVMSLGDGLRTWRLHPDPQVAVLALALVAVVIGILAKGQVESVFEKYRLATVWGLAFGMLRSAVTSAGQTGLAARRPLRRERT